MQISILSASSFKVSKRYLVSCFRLTIVTALTFQSTSLCRPVRGKALGDSASRTSLPDECHSCTCGARDVNPIAGPEVVISAGGGRGTLIFAGARKGGKPTRGHERR